MRYMKNPPHSFFPFTTKKYPSSSFILPMWDPRFRLPESEAESAGSLEKEVYHLQRELLQERTKVPGQQGPCGVRVSSSAESV